MRSLVRIQLAPPISDVTQASTVLPRGIVVVKMLRRAAVALGLAALIAAILRLRGTGGVPPQEGGWRELSSNDLA